MKVSPGLVVILVFTLWSVQPAATITKVSSASKQKKFEEVVTHGLCNKKTCRRANDIITCCHLSALRELGKVADGETVDIPRSLRLHIVKIKASSLCTDDVIGNGATPLSGSLIHDKCNSTTVKLSLSRNTIFKRVAGLTITKTSLEYISEDFFNLFPKLKHLVIEKNPMLKEIPAINQLPKPILQTISYIGNIKVQMVRWIENSPLPALKEFLFSNFLEKAGDPVTDFYMGPFTPGKKLKAFKIRLNYQNSHVSMPVMSEDSKLSQLYVGSTNIPENLRLNFTSFKGKVKTAIFNFPIKPDKIIPDFLSKDFESRFGKVNMRFDGESYELKNLDFQKNVPKERTMVTTQSNEEALMQIKREYGVPKSKIDSKGRYIFKYFILDTNDLVKLVKDSHNLDKRYIVKTHFLWVRDTAFLRKSVKLHLIFYSLILTPGGMLWSADLKQTKRNSIANKNKNFSVAQSVAVLWRQFDLSDFYEYLTTAASLSEAIHYGENGNYTHDIVKLKIAKTMIEAAKEKDVIASASLSFLPPSQISFVEEAIMVIPKLYEFVRRDLASRTQVVPSLGPSFNEKTMLYQEIAKTLIMSEKYENKKKRTFLGIKLLTDTSTMRVETLRENLKVDITRWLDDEKESWFLLEKIRNIRQKYSDDMQPIKSDFVEILLNYNDQSKYHHLALPIQELFEQLFFQKSQQTVEGRRMHISRPKLLNGVNKAIKSVSNFLLDLQLVQNQISKLYSTTTATAVTRSKQETLKEGVGDAKLSVADPSAYFRKRMSEITNAKHLDNNSVMKTLSDFKDIKPGTVFKYDSIMQKFDRLLDSELSREMKETLTFKTSLLRLLDVAKVEAEILYDVTRAQMNILIGNYTLDSLERQHKVLVTRTNQIISRKATNSNNEEEDPVEEFSNIRQSMMSQLKLDMLLHVQNYCDFFEYNIHTNCLLKKQFSLDASLPNILQLTNKLLVVTGRQYIGERIAPQSFSNLPIKYEYNEQCKEIVQAAGDEFHEASITIPPSYNYQPPAPQVAQIPVIKNDLPTPTSTRETSLSSLGTPVQQEVSLKPPGTFTSSPQADKAAESISSSKSISSESQRTTTTEISPSETLKPEVPAEVEFKTSPIKSSSTENHILSSEKPISTETTVEGIAKTESGEGEPKSTSSLEALSSTQDASISKPTASLTAFRPSSISEPSTSSFIKPVTTFIKLTPTTSSTKASPHISSRIKNRHHHHKRKHHHHNNKTIKTLLLKNSNKPNTIQLFTPLTSKITTRQRKTKNRHHRRNPPTKAVKMSNITIERQPVPFMEDLDEVNDSTMIKSNEGEKRTPLTDDLGGKNVLGSTSVKDNEKTTDIKDKNITQNTTLPLSTEEAKLQQNSSNNATEKSTSVNNLTSSNDTTDLPTTSTTEGGSKKSNIIDDSLTMDVGGGTTEEEEYTEVDSISLSSGSGSGEGEQKVSSTTTGTGYMTGQAEAESEDLLAGWIDEKLGIKNHHKHHHSANAVKRNNFNRKPIRTLDGHRIRKRTAEYSETRESIGDRKKEGIYTGSREHFESMYRKCNASKIFEVRKNSLATLTISTNNKQFRGFEHVRVNEIKVFLHGVKTDNGFVQVKIRSGSFMHDKIGNKKKNFVAQRWEKDFRYSLEDMMNVQPTHKFPAKIEADSYHNQNPMDFEPTPFTTWIVSISSEVNPGLDLSGLTSIEMLFSGSLRPSPENDVRKEKNYFDRITAASDATLGDHNNSTISLLRSSHLITSTVEGSGIATKDEIDPTKKMKIFTRRRNMKKIRKRKGQKKKVHKKKQQKHFTNVTLDTIQSHIKKFARVVFNSTGDGFVNRPTKQLEKIENEKKKPFITWYG